MLVRNSVGAQLSSMAAARRDTLGVGEDIVSSGRSKLRPDGRVASKGKSVTLSISVELGTKGLDFERADIKFTGIEQAGESFEGKSISKQSRGGRKYTDHERAWLRRIVSRLWVWLVARGYRKGATKRGSAAGNSACADRESRDCHGSPSYCGRTRSGDPHNGSSGTPARKVLIATAAVKRALL